MINCLVKIVLALFKSALSADDFKFLLYELLSGFW